MYPFGEGKYLWINKIPHSCNDYALSLILLSMMSYYIEINSWNMHIHACYKYSIMFNKINLSVMSINLTFDIMSWVLICSLTDIIWFKHKTTCKWVINDDIIGIYLWETNTYAFNHNRKKESYRSTSNLLYNKCQNHWKYWMGMNGHVNGKRKCNHIEPITITKL